jgi:hypothetical protein
MFCQRSWRRLEPAFFDDFALFVQDTIATPLIA